MKKFDIVLIAAAAVALLAAFFFYPVEKIIFKRSTLVFSQWFDNEAQRDILDNIIAEFEETHHGVTVIPVYRSYQGVKNDCAYYAGVIQDEQASGKKNNSPGFPDIVSIDPIWFDDSEKRILFANQNMSETLDAGTRNDEFSKPLYSYFDTLFYNIKILEAAGFDRPPKTRAEFMSVCLKLKEKNIYGLSVSTNFFTDIFPWILSDLDATALQTLNSEKNSFNFMEKNVVESIDFFNKLNEQNVLGRPPFIENEEEKINNFLAGKTAMITASSQLINLLESEYSDLNFGVTTIPYPEGHPGRPIFNMNCVHAAVLSTSPHKEDAFEFIELLSSKKAALAAAAGAIPEDAAYSVFGSSRNDAESEPAISVKTRNMIESAEIIEDWQIFPLCASLNSIAGEEISSMLKYNHGAEKTAAAIKKRYDSVVE
jgi:multiple sugar transport system substrate-binding protein